MSIAIANHFLQKFQRPFQKVTMGPRWPQERCYTIDAKWTRQPNKERETSEKTGMYYQIRPCRKRPQVHQTFLKTPQKTLSGTFERLSRSDTAENTVKANFQGVGPHLVKLKQNQLWADANSDSHIRIREGKPPRITTPKRAAQASAKK